MFARIAVRVLSMGAKAHMAGELQESAGESVPKKL